VGFLLHQPRLEAGRFQIGAELLGGDGCGGDWSGAPGRQAQYDADEEDEAADDDEEADRVEAAADELAHRRTIDLALRVLRDQVRAMRADAEG
jgi:hypothetical protein